MTGPRADRPSLVPLPAPSRLLLRLAAGTILVGCGSAETSIPREWRPLRPGTTAGSPPVAGRYGVESELLFTTLDRPAPVRARTTIAWSAFTLQGDGDTALTAIVRHVREDADTLHLRRGEAYQCTDGWLAPTFPRDGLASDGTDHDAQALRGPAAYHHVWRSPDLVWRRLRIRATALEWPFRCPMGTASTTEHQCGRDQPR